MTGLWPCGGVRLQPTSAPNPWLLSHPYLLHQKIQSTGLPGADNKKEGWRESTGMKLTGINAMGLKK